MRKLVTVLTLAVAAGSGGCSSDGMGSSGMMGSSPAGQGMMGTGSTGVMLAGVSPAAGTQGVPAGTRIELWFSAPMPASMAVQMDLHLGDLSGPSVAVACVPSSDRTRVTCTPGAALRPGTTYVTHVGGGMSAAGSYCGSGSMMGGSPMMGGQWVGNGGMMTPSHGGMSWGGMGNWADGCGGYGMGFTFTTA